MAKQSKARQGKAISVKPMKSKQLKQWNFRTNTQRIDGGNGSGSASEVSICVLVSYMCVSVCVRMRVCGLSALLKYLYIYIVNI